MRIFSSHYIKSKSGVSPVISSMLMIALVVAGAVTIAVVLDNTDQNPTVNTSDADIGSLATPSQNVDLNVSIAKLSYNKVLWEAEGEKYYTSVNISVDYTGNPADPAYIYVLDIDIISYGEKLDEIAPWNIVSVSGAVLETDSNGKFAGYRQDKNTVATYLVELSDTTIKKARITDGNSFSYTVKMGDVPGLITQSVSNEELSKIVFDIVSYRVAIVHFDQKIKDTKTALRSWSDVLIENNGTTENKIYFLSNSSDIYNIKNKDLVNLNMTWFTGYYDLVIFAEWAIHKDASSFARTVYQSNTSMVFGGSINNIYKDFDATVTEEILGVVPTPYKSKKAEKIGESWLQFNTSTSELLIGYNGKREDPLPELRGNDAAILSSTVPATQLGQANITLFKYDKKTKSQILKFTHEGVSFVVRDKNDTTGEPTVSALIANPYLITYSKTIFRNMIFYSFSEPNRILVSKTNLRMDNYQKNYTPDFRNIGFLIEMTVINGDIKNGTLNFKLMMDSRMKWDKKIKNLDARITIGATSFIIKFDVLKSKDFDMIQLDIGSAYPFDITKGSKITVDIADGKLIKMKKDKKFPNSNIESVYQFAMSFTWFSMDAALGTFTNSTPINNKL